MVSVDGICENLKNIILLMDNRDRNIDIIRLFIAKLELTKINNHGEEIRQYELSLSNLINILKNRENSVKVYKESMVLLDRIMLALNNILDEAKEQEIQNRKNLSDHRVSQLIAELDLINAIEM
ncbi:hypothetical protein FPHOBKDP_00056 [Listeria phage LPJP1]|nr:hypothetical protein FPHOBKDP_00056 [Listeria phage LPJP1]